MPLPLEDRLVELEGRLEGARNESAYHAGRLHALRGAEGEKVRLQREAHEGAVGLLGEAERTLLAEIDRLPETTWYGRLGKVV